MPLGRGRSARSRRQVPRPRVACRYNVPPGPCGSSLDEGSGAAMGSFIYDRSVAIDIDDRALAHLLVVILDKLRRNESFALDLWDSKHWSTIWVSQRTPLEFVYAGN